MVFLVKMIFSVVGTERIASLNIFYVIEHKNVMKIITNKHFALSILCAPMQKFPDKIASISLKDI